MEMKTIKVYQYGLETMCEGLEDILGKGLSSNSKKVKDVCISQALGLVKALRLAYEIEDSDCEETEK